MFKLIKWLILILIIAGIVLWFTNVKVGDRTLKERFNEFKKTTLYQEGIKDVRSIVGEALKALGEEISGEVTDEERAELEKVIKEEMVNSTTGSKTINQSSEGNQKWQQQQPLKALPALPKQEERAK